jgi:uncharacterized lipoprotein YajG
MKITFTILLSGLLFCGCSHKQATLAGSAIDRIQTGTDTTWAGGHVLHVTQRDGSSLRGIQMIHNGGDGVKITYTADVGTVSPGKLQDPAATNFVTIVIHNAKAEGVTQSGEKVSSTENVTFQLSPGL